VFNKEKNKDKPFDKNEGVLDNDDKTKEQTDELKKQIVALKQNGKKTVELLEENGIAKSK